MDPPRVLVVEDFEDLRKLVAFYLSARGYQVLKLQMAEPPSKPQSTENPISFY
jgi:DNA-binding response OmpR family regulator